jgi:hypothetical protein
MWSIALTDPTHNMDPIAHSAPMMEPDCLRCFITDKLVAMYLCLAAHKALLIPAGHKSLSCWSTHSIRVTAANLLHWQLFVDSFIQMRLQWKSTLFLMYLHNTFYAAEQHTALDVPDSCLPPLAERTYRPVEPHEEIKLGAAAA